jgi:hypothetical protein
MNVYHVGGITWQNWRKVHPITCPDGTERSRGIALLFLWPRARWGGWLMPRPNSFTAPPSTGNDPVHIVGEGRSGWVRDISPPPGFDPRTVQSVAKKTGVYGKNVSWNYCLFITFLSSDYYLRKQSVYVHFFRRVRKITKSDYYLRHVCPSVCPHATTGSYWTDFHEILYLSVLRKSVEKIQVSLKPDKITGTLHFWSYPEIFFLEWDMSEIKVVEKIKTHTVCSITFFFIKACRLWDNAEKYCRSGQATDDNMAHKHCMLDT